MSTAVYPDDVVVSMGLGGIFRNRLINESFVSVCLPLHESKGTAARDICGMLNHGTLVGSNFTRAISVPLPEGALALGFNGTEKVVVPDDALSTGRNLSAAGGSMDLVFIIRTTYSGSTKLCIMQKQTSGDNGPGYHVAIQNSEIRFALYVTSSPSSVFDFGRGSVADGQWHTVHCFYDPATGIARIYIDGVQSGATVTGVTTEPDYVATDFVVGMFDDASGPLTQTALAYVQVGREGNPDLSASLETTWDWTDVSDDVLYPLSWSRGIQGTGVNDNTAGVGTFSFQMDNGATNTAGLVGYYSIGHANCRSGFVQGIPVKLEVLYGTTEDPTFFGFLKAADPTPGEFSELITTVTCVDWMHIAMRAFTSALAIQLDTTSDEMMGAVIDAAERPPTAIELHTGSEIFPFGFDSSHGEDESPMSEFVRINGSERGITYVRKDGTVVCEGRALRQVVTENAALFTFQQMLEPTTDADRIINVVRATYYPRSTGELDTDVLASLPTEHSEHFLPPLGTFENESAYRDPDQKVSRVGGTDLQSPPTATTDYTLNSDPSGTGSDLTANLSVVAVDGGNLVRWIVTNTSASLGGYITKLQQRGRVLRYDEPQTIVERDEGSIRQHGERPLRIDLPYVASSSAAQGIARMILGLFSDLPAPVPASSSFLANYDDQTFRDVMERDIGDRIGLQEPVNVIDDDDGRVGYFIQSIEGTIEPGDIITVKFGLTLALPTGAWVLGEVGFSELGETTYVGL